ncbi:MAG: DUF4878 domain-containing protein [Bacteroidales bacterium]|nr:DUF4878 domain-containing protein [Bacteroidales bacterium]
MKKVFKILSLAVVSFVMITACNSDEKEIKTVATNYLRAINFDCDFEKAKEYATPETYDLLDLLNQFWSMSMDSIDSDFRDMYANSTVDITSVEIFDDSTANVQYLLTVIDKEGNVDNEAFGEEGGKGELMVKKLNGQWLAHQSKEESQDDEILEDEILEESEEIDDSI